jgi:tetratricopeptide (TPR) repeat protein
LPRPSKTARALVKKGSSQDSSWFKTLSLAAEAGKKGDYRLAVKILGELISEIDAPPEAWLLLGRSLHALNDHSRALAAFYDYLRLRPKSAEGYFFIGRTYLAIGMPYKAVPFLRKALEAGKNRSGEFASKARALLGIAYLKSKHSQKAVETLQEAVGAAPDDKRIYRAYLNCLFVRGIRLCGIEDYELGRQMLLFVLENSAEAGLQEPPLLHLHLGRAARETGRLKEAFEHFTRALQITQNGANKTGGISSVGDRRIRWARASILMALGKKTEARKEIEIIRSRYSDVPELPWNSELVDLFMIRQFLEAGEWRRASEYCRAWLRQRDKKPMIHALYAEALRNLRNYEAAHNHLQRALEEEPKELDFWYADILVSWEGKDYKSLKKALRMVKSLGGDEDLVSRFTILCQSRTSSDSKANISLLQKAIHSLGPEAELMHSLGTAYLEAGLLEEAVSWFRKTIVLKGDHEASWLGEIAALEALLGEGQSACEELGACYKAYLENWPSNKVIRRERALFLIKTFEYAEAAAELEKLLAFEPSNPSLRRVLAYSYRKTGRFREAAVFLKALIRENPRNIGLIIEYSGCMERLGAADYAFAVLEKASEHFKRAADISLALGILNYRQKKNEKAFDYLREAAGFAPGDPRPYEWMAVIARENGEPDSHYNKEAEKRKSSKK